MLNFLSIFYTKIIRIGSFLLRCLNKKGEVFIIPQCIIRIVVQKTYALIPFECDRPKSDSEPEKTLCFLFRLSYGAEHCKTIIPYTV